MWRSELKHPRWHLGVVGNPILPILTGQWIMSCHHAEIESRQEETDPSLVLEARGEVDSVGLESFSSLRALWRRGHGLSQPAR